MPKLAIKPTFISADGNSPERCHNEIGAPYETPLAIRDPAIQIPRWFEEFRPCKHWKTGQLFATVADQEPNFISGRAANGTHIRQCRFCLTEILVTVDEQALPKDSRVSASVWKDLGKVVSPSARNWPGHFEGNELPRSVAVRLGSIMGMLGGSAKYS